MTNLAAPRDAPTLAVVASAPLSGPALAIPSDLAFAGDFLPAPDLEKIAARLIYEHGACGFLREWADDIALLWKKKGGQKGGKAIFGRCQALAGAARHYSGKRYLIWAAADHCRRAGFRERQLEALVHHELCHLAPGETDAVTGEQAPPLVVGHDFEGFLAELATYGPWRPDLAQARAALGQLPLFEAER
ncbi:MAG TPA: putative metallopeptidase [Thermomicrobiales bacterium]|nr:putative metallopeptidase [Thermomicrobiales bacterium]